MAHGRILFVSDVHLDAALPEVNSRFAAFLREQAAASDGLYILGDLFEAWVGDDDDDPARTSVCEALHALTGGGVPCHVQHGNRDFLLGAGFAARTGCSLLADPTVLEMGGRRIVLSHGDQLCTADVSYQRFRSVVRNRAIQRGFTALPLAARRWVAGQARWRSYARTRQLPESIMDVTPRAVEDLFRATGADILIHGHTHRPGVHRLEVDGRPCTRIVLGDWYGQDSMLALDADGNPDTGNLGQRTAESA